MFWLDKSWYKSQTHHRQARRQLQARRSSFFNPNPLVASRTIFSSRAGSSESKMTTSAVIFLSAVFFLQSGWRCWQDSLQLRPSPCLSSAHWVCASSLFLGRRKVSYVMTKQQLWLNVWFDCTRKYDWIFVKNSGKQLWVMSHTHCSTLVIVILKRW